MSDRTTTSTRANPAARPTAEEKLAQLRELVLSARAMPMSASCVINRGDVLSSIDEVIDHLPDELGDAQRVIDRSSAKIAEGEAERERLVAEAKNEVARLARESEIVKTAETMAAKILADAEQEAAALRKETDLFIDSRMASFESVLHKTSSQVRTARGRLAERSNLDPSRQTSTSAPGA
jgi:chromosome segregation ATPase